MTPNDRFVKPLSRRTPKSDGMKSAFILVLVLAAPLSGFGQRAATFEGAVSPILRQTCAGCHNETTASGGLNLKALDRRTSIASHRTEWETVLRKLTTGEMPPPAVTKPAGLAAMAAFIESELNRLDRLVKPDPGRITARRGRCLSWGRT